MKALAPRIFSVAILIIALVSAIAAADSQADEAAIRDVVQTRQQKAWNQHDAKAYAALFAEDGEVVNVVGWWWRGRNEIERKLTDAFALVFRESTLTITEATVRFLTPEIAVAHVALDNVWCEDTTGNPGAPGGHTNHRVAEARRNLDDRGFPEHKPRA